MIRKVYKYPVKTIFDLALPKNHKVLRVEEQYEAPQIWIEMEVTGDVADFDVYTFFVFGTGHDITDDRLQHTYSWESSESFIWHLYYRKVG